MSLRKIRLGRSGLEVTELCFGTLILGKLQADLAPAEGARAIRRALELGVNFIDTAKGYKTYDHTRLGVEGFSDVVIASKSPVAGAKEMREDVETCLRDIGRETIDIFHLHLIKTHEDMVKREGALETLIRCREEGKIRAIGLSAHGPGGVLCALESEEIDIVFPIVNRKGLGINGGSLDDMIAAVRKVHATGRGLYAMKPFGGGHLIDDIPASIDFIRELSLFHSVAVGLKTPEEAEIMVGVFEGKPEAIELAHRTGKERAQKKRLHVYDWLCEKCGECVGACAQGAMSLGEKSAEVDPDLCILCGYCAAACPNFAIRVI